MDVRGDKVVEVVEGVGVETKLVKSVFVAF